MKRLIRSIVVCGCAVALAGGCFGKFALTRKVYDFNESIGNKWARTAVYWAFSILPIYALSVFVDSIIFNLLEFWTGENPLMATADDGSSIRMTQVTPDVIRIVREKAGQAPDVIELVAAGERAGMVRREDGTVLSSFEVLDDGSLAVAGPAGTRVVAAEAVKAIAARGTPSGIVAGVRALETRGELASR